MGFTNGGMPAALRTQRAEHRFVFNIQQIEIKYRRINPEEDLALVTNEDIDEVHNVEMMQRRNYILFQTVYDATMGVAPIKSINRLLHENVVCLAANEAGDTYDNVDRPDRKQQKILQVSSFQSFLFLKMKKILLALRGVI